MPKLCPTPPVLANNANGFVPGAKLYTYAAGTSSPLATFTDSTGSSANTNPVIADARGQMSVWLADDAAYKLRLTDAADNLLWEFDNVSGIPESAGSGGTTQASEWLTQALTPTFVSATSYTVPGDQTPTLQVGRRHRAQVTGGVSYGTIATSAFGGGVTTVTLTNDSLPLDAGLSEIAVGINSALNPSISTDCVVGLGAIASVPTGAVLPYAGATPPSGYLLCNGDPVSRTTYAALYAITGDTFGAGDGSTTFNVPDLRGRGPIGFGQGDTAEGGGTGTARSIGDKLGAETHTLTVPEIPAHDHPVSQPSGSVGTGGSGTQVALPAAGTTTGQTGGGGGHNNMGPSLVVGFIIKT